MTDYELLRIASHYTVWSSHTGEGVANAENAAYEAGFRKAIELVNRLNDGHNATFYVYDTVDLS